MNYSRVTQLIDFIRVFSIYNIGSSRYNECMVNENTVEVGSVVKSLDFPSTTDCYYVGLVTAILPDGTFRANKIKRVWEGKIEVKFWSDTFVAPLPGQHMFDDEWIEPRIQVVA